MLLDFAYFDHMDKAGPSGISPKVKTNFHSHLSIIITFPSLSLSLSLSPSLSPSLLLSLSLSQVVTISIISGQQLPKPEGGSSTGEVIDPYVQIQFAGLPKDCTQFKTKVINDNGNHYCSQCTLYYVVLYF